MLVVIECMLCNSFYLSCFRTFPWLVPLSSCLVLPLWSEKTKREWMKSPFVTQCSLVDRVAPTRLKQIWLTIHVVRHQDDLGALIKQWEWINIKSFSNAGITWTWVLPGIWHIFCNSESHASWSRDLGQKVDVNCNSICTFPSMEMPPDHKKVAELLWRTATSMAATSQEDHLCEEGFARHMTGWDSP